MPSNPATPNASPSAVARVKATVDRVLGGVLAALMGLAVVNVLWQVFTRFVLDTPSSFTDELARYLLVWIGLLGAAYAGGKRLHLAIDLLPRTLSGRAEHALGVFIEATVGAFALFVMVIGGARLVGLTLMLGQTSAALQVPLGYVYLVLPISGVLLLFYAALFLTEHVRLFLGRPPLLPDVAGSQAEAFAEGTDERRGADVEHGARAPDTDASPPR